MSAHYPSPWHVEFPSFGALLIRCPTGDVADVRTKGLRVSRDVHPETLATAHLIAASPDLLAMVKRYASECAECGGTGTKHVKWFNGGIENDGEAPCDECADVRALIAKASP
jgi:hypothetical protein